MKKIQVIRVGSGGFAFDCETRAEANRWIAERVKLAGHSRSMYDIKKID